MQNSKGLKKGCPPRLGARPSVNRNCLFLFMMLLIAGDFRNLATVLICRAILRFGMGFGQHLRNKSIAVLARGGLSHPFSHLFLAPAKATCPNTKPLFGKAFFHELLDSSDKELIDKIEICCSPVALLLSLSSIFSPPVTQALSISFLFFWRIVGVLRLISAISWVFFHWHPFYPGP